MFAVCHQKCWSMGLVQSQLNIPLNNMLSMRMKDRKVSKKDLSVNLMNNTGQFNKDPPSPIQRTLLNGDYFWISQKGQQKDVLSP